MKFNPFNKTIYLLISLLLFGSNLLASTTSTFIENSGVPTIIIIHKPDQAKAEKEAILLLPGFTDSRKTRKKQVAFFGNLPYDLYIPDFHNRNSFDATVEQLGQFYQAQALDAYHKVHVLSYIVGSWVLNELIHQQGRKNISTIIYDRSPLQERAPRVVMDRIAIIGKLAEGNLLCEFSKLAYRPVQNDSIQIGIIVEGKATPLIKFFKKKVLSYGPVDWSGPSFQQPYADLFYTPLNHSQMYRRFDIIGPEILHFIEKGTFRADAQRIPFDWDPFKKWKE